MKTSNDSEDQSTWTDPRLTRRELTENLEKRVELLITKKTSAKFFVHRSQRIPEQYEHTLLGDEQQWKKYLQEVGPDVIMLDMFYNVCSVSNSLKNKFWLKCTFLSELLRSICQNFQTGQALSSIVLCRPVIEHIGMTVLACDEFLQAEKRFTAGRSEKSKLGEPSFAIELNGIMSTRFEQHNIDNAHYMFNSLRTNVEKYYRQRAPVYQDQSAKDLMQGVKALNRTVKGARRVYDFASELAHPNTMYSNFYLQVVRPIRQPVTVELFNGKLDFSRQDLSLNQPSESDIPLRVVAHRLIEVLQVLGESIDRFIHIEKTMHRIAGLAATDVKNRLKAANKHYLGNTGREIVKEDDLCPCLSGKVFRLCCAL